MLVKKAKTIKLIYSLAFSVMSLALAFLLILQVCDIYFNGGNSPFTIEAIKAHFNEIFVAIIVWLVLMIGGFIIWEIFPPTKKVQANDDYYKFYVLRKKLENQPIYDSENARKFIKGQEILNIIKTICALCVLVCIIFCLAFLFDKNNFTNQNQNLEVAKAWLYLLPFIVIAFALVIGVYVFEKAMIKKQTSIVRELIKEKAQESSVVKLPFLNVRKKLSAFFDDEKVINSLRVFMLIIGIALLIFGLATGGNASVLAKAVTICRQCIGLG